MNLNKSTQFALYAVVELARDLTEKLSVTEIAQRYDVSEHHMSKVMQTLVRFSIVSAVRGAGGGYQLSRPAKEITVMDIIKIFEPDFLRSDCQLRSNGANCPQLNLCAISDLFREVSHHVSSIFTAVSIDNLAQKTNKYHYIKIGDLKAITERK